MIVLAIAAALILLVFLAVSGAQKAKRDTIRKREAGQIMAAIELYLNDNGGNFNNLNFVTGLPSAYLTNIVDPLTGQPPSYDATRSALTSPGITYAAGAICDTSTPGQLRNYIINVNYAVVYWSEVRNGPICIDNNGNMISS